MKWEYKSLLFAGSAENWILGNLGPRYWDKTSGGTGFYEDPALDSKLNEIAQDGWELFNVMQFAPGSIEGQYGTKIGSFTFIFRRQQEQAAP